MVLHITEEELIRMRAVVLDRDLDAAVQMIKDFVKRLDQAQRGGLKSHLNG